MKRNSKTLPIITALTLILISAIFEAGLFGLAASNTVQQTRVDQISRAIQINNLRPPGCSGIDLVNIIYCTGTAICNGTTGSDLILGNSENNLINGRSKKANPDCIVAGGGDDIVQGGNKEDICIEGPGNDDYKKCTVVIP